MGGFNLKVVRILKINNPPESFTKKLDDLMRNFCAAKRFAFNRLLEGNSSNKVNKMIQAKYPLNKRYAEDAVLLAKSIIKQY